MVGITSSAATLALLGLAAAAPAPTRRNGVQATSFIVTNEPTGNNVTRNGLSALTQALGKYGVAMNAPATKQGNAVGSGSSPVTSVLNTAVKAVGQTSSTGSNTAAAGSETGEVDATSQMNDLEYTARIQVGKQTMQVNFDTGSADLWLFNTKMSQQARGSHNLYDPTQSGTFQQKTDSKFAVHYGDGSQVSGSTVGTENVNIGGADVSDQIIELPDTVAASLLNDKNADGLVGLAFNTINTVTPVRANTFIEKVAPQLKQQVFTANLKHAATGSYEFGNIDTTQYTGDMIWVPVDKSKGLWQFTSDFYSIGNGPAKNNNGASPAIADTGTSLLLMDAAVANDYWSQVQGAGSDASKGGFVFPCNAQLPDLNVGLLGSTDNGGKLNKISGSLMNYSTVNSTHCFGALQSNEGTGLQIMGDPLFKSAFVAFDIGNSSLGFASHAN